MERIFCLLAEEKWQWGQILIRDPCTIEDVSFKLSLMMTHALPFTANSDVFRAFQHLWLEEVHEELTYERAQEYGPKILALVGAVARWKRSQQKV